MLPVKSTSNEELASYLWGELINAVGLERFHSFNVRRIQYKRGVLRRHLQIICWAFCYLAVGD